MTNEELQAHIKALNDAAERGEIETNISSAEWEPTFRKVLTAHAYRIKPRDVWINFYQRPNDYCVHDSKEAAVRDRNTFDGTFVVCRHFREVLDDES